MPPLEAPSVPVSYQLVKSVGRSCMALAEIVDALSRQCSRHIRRASLLACPRSQMQSALNGIQTAEMPADWKDTNRAILKNNIAFMDDCANKGVITVAAMQDFAKRQAPL